MGMVCFRDAPHLAVWLLWAALPALAWCQAEQYEGKRIIDIQFSPPEQPVDSVELRELIPLQRGAAFRMAGIQTAIQKLFATGCYEDIQVDAETAAGGVRVRFITKNSWFVGPVTVEGNVGDPPNRGQMINATRLELGQAFHEDNMAPSEDGLNKLLVANGYYENRIRRRIDYDPKTQQAHVHFVLESGPRAGYRTPNITGNLKMAVDKIITATRWKHRLIGTWRPVTQSRTRQGLDNIRSKYQNDGRLMASAQLKSMDYDRDTRRVKPNLDIDAGPKVQVNTVCAKVYQKKLRQNIPIYEEHTVDRDLLIESQRNLRDEFQSAGYFEDDVQFKQQRLLNDTAQIDYLINLGKRHNLVHLEIRGNHYFPTESIRQRMFMTPKSFSLRHGRYSEALRRRDEESIVNLYNENGFRDVKVTTEVQDDYKGKIGDIAVILKIDEGPQWFVSKLEVFGIEQLDAASIIPTLSSSQGQPFSEFNVAADRDRILAMYFTNGFPNASFEWCSKPGLQAQQVDLRFVIMEGQRQFVRDVIVEGLETTRPQLVQHNLLLASGDPLSPIQMADTQRRLYNLGIFAKVDMAIQNPDGQLQRKYVVYDIEEARRYSFDGGLGAEIARIGGCQCPDLPAGATGVSPRVSFDASRLNFLGWGHTISLRTRISTLERRGLIDYLAPHVRGYDNLDLSFTALYDSTRDVNTFSAKREEGSVQLSQKLSKPSTILYRFSYRRVSTSNLLIDPNLIPLLSQPVRVGILSSNYIQDRRDDSTDAHKGIYNTVDVGVASKFFGSQIDMVRGLASNATYHRIRKNLVLAREVTFGDIIPFRYGSRTSNAELAVPFPERFFGGGGTSLRAFPENQAGPRDLTTGFPIGGTALLFHKTELRFPLAGANISAVAFHDAGNVYSTLSNLSFGFHQRDVKDFDYMVHAVGFGIRYRTPIGPVRVDLAYSINPPRFFGCKGNISQLVECGKPENIGLRTDQRINHFQFFFSIGQAF